MKGNRLICCGTIENSIDLDVFAHLPFSVVLAVASRASLSVDMTRSESARQCAVLLLRHEKHAAVRTQQL
jgi:hypothetical protein